MKNLTQQEIDYTLAKESVAQRRKFYISLAIFLLVVCFYVLRRFFKTGEFPFLDQNHFSIVFWIWGIVLAVKAVKIFFFNSTWERKMLNRELNQTNHGKF